MIDLVQITALACAVIVLAVIAIVLVRAMRILNR